MSLPACACGHPIPSEAEARRHVKVCPGQGLPAGWTLDNYNRGVLAAVAANRADRAREQGVCTVCEERRISRNRVCEPCRNKRKRKKP